jgi:hypothetical protein
MFKHYSSAVQSINIVNSYYLDEFNLFEWLASITFYKYVLIILHLFTEKWNDESGIRNVTLIMQYA